MIYHLTLQTTGLAAGLLLIVTHAFALIRTEQTVDWSTAFPRSRGAGTILIAIAAIWSFLLVQSIDLGEFSQLRNIMLMAIVAGAILSWIYVPEFLAVRSLGMLLLLASEPLLESAVLRHETSRLLLVVLAYVWVIAGLFYVGMPYVLRDAIQWVTTDRNRLKFGALVGLVYGIALVFCSLFFW